jgi:hypothetical protein
MDSSFDYTLKIDFYRCSVRDLHFILHVLKGASTMCNSDIVEMANETIFRLNEIGYDITDPQYTQFRRFIHSIFALLRQLNIGRQLRIIHENYNEFSKQRQTAKGDYKSPVSSPGTPINCSPPRIMRKAPRKKLTNDQ